MKLFRSFTKAFNRDASRESEFTGVGARYQCGRYGKVSRCLVVWHSRWRRQTPFKACRTRSCEGIDLVQHLSWIEPVLIGSDMDEVAWEARGVALQVVSSSSGGSSAEAAMRVADLCARNSASWMLKVVFASFWVFWKTHRPQLEKRRHFLSSGEATCRHRKPCQYRRLSAKRRIHTLDVPRSWCESSVLE